MLFVLLIPIGTLALGDAIAKAWLKEDLVGLVNRLLAGFVVGTTITLSCLLFGGLIGILVPVEIALGGLLGVSCVYWGSTYLPSRRLSLHLPKLGWLDWAAAAVFLGYLTKVLLVLATKPIQDADAMAVYIPMGRVFTTLGRIPVFDPFHYWTFSSEPGVSLMYSWALTLSGSSQSEAFRVIPTLAFVLLPLAVLVFVQRTFKNRSAASIALILTVFMPGLDFLLFYYSFYLDAYAITFMLLALIFYQEIPSKRFRAEVLVGMCLGCLLLIKYDFGIFATAAIALLLISRMFANPVTTRVVRVSGAAVISAVFVVAGNKIWGLFSGGDVVYFPILLLIGLLLIVSYHYTDELKGQIAPRSLAIIFLFMLPAVVWGIRCLLIGASLFGVTFLRLFASPQGNVLNVAGYYSASSFSPFTILEPFLHPWYNLFFFPVSILALLYAARQRKYSLTVFLFLAYFLYYLTIIGDFPSGRHLMFDGLMNACVVGLLLADYRPQRFLHWKYFMIAFYCATSLLAWPTVYLGAVTGSASSLLQDLGGIPYADAYTYGYMLSTFSQHFLPFYGALAAGILLTYLFHRHVWNSGSSAALKRVGRVSLLVLVLVGSFIQFAPYLALSSTQGNGNILNFANVGSYYQSDLNVAAAVVKVLPPNSTIITYANPALAYTYPKVLDLYRGGEPYLFSILQGLKGENVSSALLRHGFSYLLLPSAQNSQFRGLTELADSTPWLQQILNNPWILSVNSTLSGWILYKIMTPF
jgi:hypothetical protein